MTRLRMGWRNTYYRWTAGYLVLCNSAILLAVLFGWKVD